MSSLSLSRVAIDEPLASENLFPLLGCFHTFSGSTANSNQQGLSVSYASYRPPPILVIYRSTPLCNWCSWHRQQSLPSFQQLLCYLRSHYSSFLPALKLSYTIPNICRSRLVVAITTVWSGLSYVFSKEAVRIISERRKPKTPPP